jgi:hypothetical protein
MTRLMRSVIEPRRIFSWGGIGGNITSLAMPAFSSEIRHRFSSAAANGHGKSLIIGNLRSYGDEVLCPDGNYLQTILCEFCSSIPGRIP